MGLHDFRRSAATTMALEQPEQASLIPAILQHSGFDTSDRHYKLGASAKAGKRFAGRMTNLHEPADDGFWEI
jgi:hypothetical protein